MDADSLILFLFFLLCSAYCASAETAYTAVSRVRLRTMVDKGNKKAKKALWVCDRFDKTLTTILIGNNVFHASCAALSTLLVIKQFSSEYVVYGTLLTTIIVYLFAEMIPKSVAKVRSFGVFCSIIMVCPTTRLSGFCMPFELMSCAGSVPYSLAISESVSPARTV